MPRKSRMRGMAVLMRRMQEIPHAGATEGDLERRPASPSRSLKLATAFFEKVIDGRLAGDLADLVDGVIDGVLAVRLALPMQELTTIFSRRGT